MKKKILALILSVAIFATAFALPSYAAPELSSAEIGLNQVLDKVVDALVNGITSLIFEPHSFESKDDYKSENFYEGNTPEEFINVPAEDAAWKLGYSNASILTGKELTEEHYVGGSLSVTKKLADEVRDDQMVRTIAISDGRGISIFTVLDAFGLANNEVRVIREKFQAYADSQGLDITSINISVLHQHSSVDTFGLNGDIINALFTSSIKNLLDMELASGKNKNFMENLYKVTVDSMINATNNMTEGKLYYGTSDITEYIRDKRDPQVFDSNMNRLRFVPADGSKETWIINTPMHCVGNGAAGTMLTGDYPYYMEQYINEVANANFMMILGAELAITAIYPEVMDLDEELMAEYNDEGYARMAAFGELMGKIACDIVDSEEVAPILSIRFKEISVPVKNSIFRLAARGGLLTNKVVKNGLDYEVVTEVGYAEFGTNLSVALIPGELAPEIAYGGAIAPEDTWNGEEWNYSPFVDATERKLLVFGVTNDQIGYMLTSNDWRSYFTENEEIVSTGPNAGAYIADAYLTLVNEIK